MLKNKKQIPQLLETAVGSSAFLLDAVKELHFKTPKLIADYVEKHKYDCLIQNPPYENNNIQSKT